MNIVNTESVAAEQRRPGRDAEVSETIKIICPNGHLGFSPLKPGSFWRAVEAGADVIAADSGSDDIGPVPLATDTSSSPRVWQEQDLEQMLLASRRLDVPMIIGSAGDTGTNSRVDMYVEIIRALQKKHGLSPFKLGWFYSDVDKEWLRGRMRAGSRVLGLDARPELTEAELDATDHIVAMAGVHPYRALLEQGCDVIIGGRSSDSAIFAAAALHRGFAEPEFDYLGKVLECASFCAEPYGAKETVMGEISAGQVEVTANVPGPALHGGLGCRPCHVRALQSVQRVRRRRGPT